MNRREELDKIDAELEAALSVFRDANIQRNEAVDTIKRLVTNRKAIVDAMRKDFWDGVETTCSRECEDIAERVW